MKLITFVLVTITSIVQPVVAQDSDTDGVFLDEVVVTAQRREQNIQDVGISITAFSGSQLRKLGFNNAPDIARQTPGLVMPSTAPGGLSGVPTIRGVSQNDYSKSQEPPNAVYFDEAYFSSIGLLNFALFDLERVEVLRGPQGTLFGRNSTGGLISFVSAKPTEDFDSAVDLTVGSYNQIRLEAFLSGPIGGDKLLGRISVLRETRDGFVENRLPGGKDAAEQDDFGVRVALEYKPSDKSRFLLSLNVGDSPSHAVGTYQHIPGILTDEGLGANNPGYPNDPTAVDNTGSRDPYADPHVGEFQDNGFLERNLQMATLLAEFELLDDISLISLSNYHEYESDYGDDSDGTAATVAEFYEIATIEQWSQEFRFVGSKDSFDWTVGVFYLEIESDNFNNYFIPDPDLFIPAFGVPVEFNANSTWFVDTESWSAFAHGEYELSPKLSVIAGVRYTSDEKTTEAQTFYTEPNFGLSYDFTEPNAGGLTLHEEDAVTYKLQFNYRPNEDWLVFGGISSGYKSGGFNSPIDAGVSIEDTPFDPENMVSFEIGTKATILNGRGRFNASAFYYDYSDYQGFDFTGISAFIGNYDAIFYGGELELQLSSNNGWDVSLGLALLDTEVKGVQAGFDPGSGAPLIRSREAPMAPPVTVNGLIRKAWNLSSNAEISTHVSFHYLDDRYSGISNSPALLLESTTTIDLRLGYLSPDGKWDVSLFGRNVTDEDVPIFAYDQAGFFGFNLKLFGPPRTYGLQLSYRYQ